MSFNLVYSLIRNESCSTFETFLQAVDRVATNYVNNKLEDASCILLVTETQSKWGIARCKRKIARDSTCKCWIARLLICYVFNPNNHSRIGRRSGRVLWVQLMHATTMGTPSGANPHKARSAIPWHSRKAVCRTSAYGDAEEKARRNLLYRTADTFVCTLHGEKVGEWCDS